MKARTLELAETVNARYRADILRLQRWAKLQPWNGRDPVKGVHRARVNSVADRDLGVSVLFTLDSGAHASGWWRNSQYETCWHLSIVGFVRGAAANTWADLPREEIAAWGVAFFGEHAAKAWNEPPAAEHDPHRSAAASRFTWHTRLFVDQQMRPIIPAGEVYTLIPFDDGTSPVKVFR